MYGPVSMTENGDKLALIVTSPFSKGKIYVVPQNRVEREGVPVLEYNRFF